MCPPGWSATRGVKDPALIRAFIANARAQRHPVPAAPRRRMRRRSAHAHVEAWREAYAGLVPDAVLAALDPHERAAMWRDALAKGGAVQLAERDGGIVGFASSGPQRDASLPYSGEIYALYVLQAAQRQGIGRALMSGTRTRSAGAGARQSAVLWVMEGNTRSARFYEALGGREVARREQQPRRLQRNRRRLWLGRPDGADLTAHFEPAPRPSHPPAGSAQALHLGAQGGDLLRRIVVRCAGPARARSAPR